MSDLLSDLKLAICVRYGIVNDVSASSGVV